MLRVPLSPYNTDMYVHAHLQSDMQALLGSADRTAFQEKTQICVSNLATMIQAARAAAQCSEDDISLLDGSKQLAEAVARLLMTQKLHGVDDPRTKEAQKQFAAAQRFVALALEGKGMNDTVTVSLLDAYRTAALEAVTSMKKLAEELATSTDSPKKEKFTAAAKQALTQTNDALKLTEILQGCTASDDCRDMVVQAVQGALALTAGLPRAAAAAQPRDSGKAAQFLAASGYLDEALRALADIMACSQPTTADDYAKLQKTIADGVITLHGSLENKDLVAKGTRLIMTAGEKLINSLVLNEAKTGDENIKAHVSKGTCLIFTCVCMWLTPMFLFAGDSMQ